jgi:hypothetical protein
MGFGLRGRLRFFSEDMRGILWVWSAVDNCGPRGFDIAESTEESLR